jgi:hypothetical protein
MGEWRKLHSEELHNLYFSPNIIMQIKSRRMSWVWHVAHVRGDNSVQGFGGKARRKDTTWKMRHRWEDMILGRLAGECGADSVGLG